MSLGSGVAVGRRPRPGTLFPTWLPASFRYCLSLILAACCLTGSDATGFRAWAGPPEMGLVAGSPGSSPLGSVATGEASVDPFNDCERAGVAMEQANGLPPAGFTLSSLP